MLISGASSRRKSNSLTNRMKVMCCRIITTDVEAIPSASTSARVISIKE